MTLMQCFFDVSHLFCATDAGHPTVETTPASVAYRDINALPLELHLEIRDVLYYYSFSSCRDRKAVFGACSLVNRLWRGLYQPAVHEVVVLSPGCHNLLYHYALSFTKRRGPHAAPLYKFIKHLHIHPCLFWEVHGLYKNFILVCGGRIRTLTLHGISFPSMEFVDPFKIFMSQFPSVTRLELDNVKWVDLRALSDGDRRILDVAAERRYKSAVPVHLKTLTLKGFEDRDEAYKMVQRFAVCKEQKICALLKIATLENCIVRANKLLKVLGGHLQSLNIQIHCDVMTHGHQNIDAISGIDLSHNTNLQVLLVAFIRDEGRSISLAVQRLANVLATTGPPTLRTICFEFYVMTYIRVENALDASTFDPLDRLFRGGKFPRLPKVPAPIRVVLWNDIHVAKGDKLVDSKPFFDRLRGIFERHQSTARKLDIRVDLSGANDDSFVAELAMNYLRLWRAA